MSFSKPSGPRPINQVRFGNTPSANVSSFGGQPLGPSSYNPVTVVGTARPSNSTGWSVDFDTFVGGVRTDRLLHVNSPVSNWLKK